MAVSTVTNQKTIQQIIDSSSKNTSDRKTGEMGKDDFLNLLVTQLKYQDPLQPTDDKEFIGQMAQFSSLEQMQNMNTSLSQSQGFALMGKHITATITDSTTKESKAIEGDVTSVKVSSGKTYAVVKGEDVPIEKITNVTEGSGSSLTNISQYTNLIGYDVKGVVYDPATSNMVGAEGTVKSIQKGTYDDYAVIDGVNVQLSGAGDSSTSTSKDYIKEYLEAHKGEAAVVTVTDSAKNQKVTVNAVLKDYNIAADGSITATLDQVNIPVTSVATIAPVKQDATTQTASSNTASSSTGATGATGATTATAATSSTN